MKNIAMYLCVCLYIYIYTHVSQEKCNAFFLSTGIITDNIPPLNQSIYSYLEKFYWLTEDAESGEYGGSGIVVHLNETIVFLVLILVCGWTLSWRRRTLSIGKIQCLQIIICLAHESGLKRQTLCQWWGSENCINEMVQRTVNRILWGRGTYSDSKEEHCY